jgi:hypothetical protein
MHANVHFSFGVGLFPFSLMASFLNGNGANLEQPQQDGGGDYDLD